MKTFCINTKVNPRVLKKDEYDVVIIGAGIGGLVCGCYLAKVGMKVLIVEKNSKVGGYCTSFSKNGFTFDMGIHSLVSCRKEGMLGNVIKELGLQNKLRLNRADPSDVIINAGYKIAIKNNTDETIENLQRTFPSQGVAIEKFFTLIKKVPFISSFMDFKEKTFKDILDSYFTNPKLKSLLSVLLGNFGLPSHRVSALAAMALYKEHIFDGGYYPIGGMQRFANVFSEKFKECGGEILLATEVKKIKISANKAKGVIIDRGDLIKSRYVVSACDASQTFLKLIGEQECSARFIRSLKATSPAVSAFLVFLGISKDLRQDLSSCCGLWYFPLPDVDICLEEMQTQFQNKGLFCMFPSFHDNNLAPQGCTSAVLMVTLPFVKEISYWEKNKSALAEKMINRFEELISNIRPHIKVKEIITPYTLYRYTLNSGGSIRGWAPTPKQLSNSFIRSKTEFENLFVTGQWLISPVGEGGISMVAVSGRRTAKLMLARRRNR